MGFTRRWSTKWAGFLLCTVPLNAAGAQEDSRIPTETLVVEGGWLRDYKAGSTGLFYLINYRGKRLRALGTPFDRGGSPVEPAARVQDRAGDGEDVVVRLERGSFSSNSAVYDMIGTKPMSFTAPSIARLRGTAQLTGRLDGRALNVAVGLETPPFHPLRELNRRTPSNITNWVILGVQGEHRESHGDESVNASSGVVTGRAFLGRGFAWGWSKKLTGVNRDLVRDALATARSFSDAQEKMSGIAERIREGSVSPAEKLVYSIAEEGDGLSDQDRRDPARWERAVTIAATDRPDLTPPDQPRFALWLEGYVWRGFGAERGTDAWLNRMVGTARFTPFPREADAIWIDLRYTNGYERADSRVRRNQLAAAVGVSL